MSIPHDTQAGVVEQRGIDLVPVSERHGRPRDLFFMWLGTNTNVFYIINGAIVISLGLNFLQSLLVILVGNLAFLYWASLACRDHAQAPQPLLSIGLLSDLMEVECWHSLIG